MKVEIQSGATHWLLAILAVWIISGCSSYRKSNPKYEAAWKQVIESEEWQASLAADDQDLYTQSGDENDLWLKGGAFEEVTADPFEQKYDSWVSRAYFKIISEAEAADLKIRAEHDRFLAENPAAAQSDDENVVRIMELYKKKYQAHQSMLEGLKSWRAFENYGSDDLEFFKEENRRVVRGMYLNGRPQEKIVEFLVYKLADLYHLEQQ